MNTIQITQIDGREFTAKIEQLESKISLLTSVVQRQQQASPKAEKPYCTILETTKLLSVSKVTLHKWKKRGILVPMKIGGRPLYKRADIEAVLLKSNELLQTKKGNGICK